MKAHSLIMIMIVRDVGGAVWLRINLTDSMFKFPNIKFLSVLAFPNLFTLAFSMIMNYSNCMIVAVRNGINITNSPCIRQITMSTCPPSQKQNKNQFKSVITSNTGSKIWKSAIVAIDINLSLTVISNWSISVNQKNFLRDCSLAKVSCIVNFAYYHR